MRKVLFILSFTSAVLLLARNSVSAQLTAEERVAKIIDAQIEFKSQEISGGLITINYSLPFNGMVEFRLFDNEGTKIWQNQYTNNFGDNRIVLRVSKLKAGKTYAYQLVYKRNMIMHSLEIPSIGGSE